MLENRYKHYKHGIPVDEELMRIKIERVEDASEEEKKE